MAFSKHNFIWVSFDTKLFFFWEVWDMTTGDPCQKQGSWSIEFHVGKVHLFVVSHRIHSIVTRSPETSNSPESKTPTNLVT